MHAGQRRQRGLLMVVDGWTSGVLAESMARGELPTLARLVVAGSLDTEGVTMFPSVTPAATASIVTGSHPADQGIAEMSWLNPSSRQVSYFGDDVGSVLRLRPTHFARSFLVRLNGDRLLAPTLMQIGVAARPHLRVRQLPDPSSTWGSRTLL